MRPYRTFTKNRRGSVRYKYLGDGRRYAYLTMCGGGPELIKGAPAKDDAGARDNLDKRLVQIARCIQSKPTDQQLQTYLHRIGLHASKRCLGIKALGLSGGNYIARTLVYGNGFAKARFYARRVLQAAETLVDSKAA